MYTLGICLSFLATLVLITEATYQQTSSQGSGQSGSGGQTNTGGYSNQLDNNAPAGPVPIPLYIPPHPQTGSSKQINTLPDVVFVVPVAGKPKNQQVQTQSGYGTHQGSAGTQQFAQTGYNQQAAAPAVQHLGYAPAPTSNSGQSMGYGSSQTGSGGQGGSPSGYGQQNTNANSNAQLDAYGTTQQGPGYNQASSSNNNQQNGNNKGRSSSGNQNVYQNMGSNQHRQSGYGSPTSNTGGNSGATYGQSQSGYGTGSTNTGSTGVTGYGQVQGNTMMSAYGPSPMRMMMLNRQRAATSGYGQPVNAINQGYVMPQVATGGYGTQNSASNTGLGNGGSSNQQNTGYATNTNNQGPVYAFMDTANQGPAFGYGSVMQPLFGMPMLQMPAPRYNTIPMGMQNTPMGYGGTGNNADSDGSGRKTVIKVAFKPTLSDGGGYGDKIPEVSYTILRTYPEINTQTGSNKGSTSGGASSSSGYGSSVGQPQGPSYGTSSNSRSTSFSGSGSFGGSSSYGGSNSNNKRGSFSGGTGSSGSSNGYSSSRSHSFNSFAQKNEGYGGYQPAPPTVFDICEANYNFDGFCNGKYPGLYSHPDPSCFLQCDHLGLPVASLCAPGTAWVKGKYEPSTTNRCMHSVLASSGEY